MANMEYYVNNEDNNTEIARHLNVIIGTKKFIISINNFDELVINKHDIEDSSSLSITPSVSNEIIIK